MLTWDVVPSPRRIVQVMDMETVPRAKITAEKTNQK